jgi:cyclic pyranopterin phosphate synthase
MHDKQDDLKSILRKGCSDEELAEVFLEAVRHKPLEHTLETDHNAGSAVQMCAIGG